jgi:hypothetical protein
VTASGIAWQPYRELAVISDIAVYTDAAAVLLGHDVVADGQAEARAFASWLGGEERLKQPVPDFAGMPIPLSSTLISTASPNSRVETFSIGAKPDFISIRCRWPAA